MGLFWAIPTAAKAPSQPNNDILKNEEFIGPIQPKAGIPGDKPRPNIRPLQPSGRNNLVPQDQTGIRHYSKEEVQQLIKDYSQLYGINPLLPLRIANCESGYNQFSKNKNSTASGVFQYLSSTWAGTDEAKAGLSVFDAGANVRAAIKYIASRGNASPWSASKSCWG